MNILIAEDDENSRALLTRIITKKFKCRVFEAKDGLEALSLVHSVSPDLLILDVMMPILDGTAVLKAIRSDPVHSALPVIISSALDEKQTVMDLLNLGVSDYLLKPLTVDVVQKRIGDVLNRIESPRSSPQT